MRARTYFFALLPIAAIWAFVMARSTSEMFALMDQVAASPRAAAAESTPPAPAGAPPVMRLEPLDLEHEPNDEPDFDDADELVIGGQEEIDDTYLDDESVFDDYAERPPLRVPLYPDEPEPEPEPEPEFPSVRDPRIDELLRRARAD